jgi:NSS family neurotransmitter:Na+ symporter
MQRDGTAPIRRWSSHRHFVLAAIGASLGLGNVWRFPQLLTEHGVPFLLAYLGALLLLGLPLLVAELVLARRMQGAISAEFPVQLRTAQAGPAWRVLPWLTLAAAWAVLVYLAVFGGWLLAYGVAALGGGFDDATVRGLALRFDALAGSPVTSMAWSSLFLGGAVAVSAAGLRRGAEHATQVALALLAACWTALLVAVAVDGQLGAGFTALVAPTLGSATGDALLAGLGQAFYTLTLGVGVMHAYAAHLPPGGALPRLASWVVLGDTLFAVVAAVAVLGLLAAAGLDADAGPRLLFTTLPAALGRLPHGGWLAVPFYLGCTLLAWLLALALLEPLLLALAAAWRLGRKRAAVAAGAVAWLPALLLAGTYAMSSIGPGSGPFAWLDVVGGKVLVPLAALLLALFVGWVLPESARRTALPLVPEAQYRTWRALLRYAVPPLLVILVGAGILRGPP